MRRLLIMMCFLGGLGLLVWLVRRSALSELDPPRVAEPGSQPSNLGVDEPGEEESAPMSPSAADGGAGLPSERELESAVSRNGARLDNAVLNGEGLMAELAQIRTDVVKRVERRPLFVMAEQRRVPYFQLFFMTKQQLFDAVVEAEGLPPHDVTPSPQSAERIKEIAAEALRLNEQMEAEEAAHLKNGTTA